MNYLVDSFIQYIHLARQHQNPLALGERSQANKNALTKTSQTALCPILQSVVLCTQRVFNVVFNVGFKARDNFTTLFCVECKNWANHHPCLKTMVVFAAFCKTCKSMQQYYKLPCCVRLCSFQSRTAQNACVCSDLHAEHWYMRLWFCANFQPVIHPLLCRHWLSSSCHWSGLKIAHDAKSGPNWRQNDTFACHECRPEQKLGESHNGPKMPQLTVFWTRSREKADLLLVPPQRHTFFAPTGAGGWVEFINLTI